MASGADYARQSEEIRQAKERAIEARDFDKAAQLRDQERQLAKRALGQLLVTPEVFRKIHRRLGLPGTPGSGRSL